MDQYFCIYCNDILYRALMSPEEGIQSFRFFFIAASPSWKVMKYDAKVDTNGC
jgi:hypothetical protein